MYQFLAVFCSLVVVTTLTSAVSANEVDDVSSAGWEKEPKIIEGPVADFVTQLVVEQPEEGTTVAVDENGEIVISGCIFAKVDQVSVRVGDIEVIATPEPEHWASWTTKWQVSLRPPQLDDNTVVVSADYVFHKFKIFRSTQEIPIVVTDTIPPSGVDDLAVAYVDSQSAMLTWLPATDNYELGGYEVQVVGGELVQVPSDEDSVELTGLSPDADYEVSVVAVDLAGNRSEPQSVTFRTITDSNPPNPPGEGLDLGRLGRLRGAGFLGDDIILEGGADIRVQGKFYETNPYVESQANESLLEIEVVNLGGEAAEDVRLTTGVVELPGAIDPYGCEVERRGPIDNPSDLLSLNCNLGRFLPGQVEYVRVPFRASLMEGQSVNLRLSSLNDVNPDNDFVTLDIPRVERANIRVSNGNLNLVVPPPIGPPEPSEVSFTVSHPTRITDSIIDALLGSPVPATGIRLQVELPSWAEGLTVSPNTSDGWSCSFEEFENVGNTGFLADCVYDASLPRSSDSETKLALTFFIMNGAEDIGASKFRAVGRADQYDITLSDNITSATAGPQPPVELELIPETEDISGIQSVTDFVLSWDDGECQNDATPQYQVYEWNISNGGIDFSPVVVTSGNSYSLGNDERVSRFFVTTLCGGPFESAPSELLEATIITSTEEVEIGGPEVVQGGALVAMGGCVAATVDGPVCEGAVGSYIVVRAGIVLAAATLLAHDSSVVVETIVDSVEQREEEQKEAIDALGQEVDEILRAEARRIALRRLLEEYLPRLPRPLPEPEVDELKEECRDQVDLIFEAEGILAPGANASNLIELDDGTEVHPCEGLPVYVPSENDIGRAARHRYRSIWYGKSLYNDIEAAELGLPLVTQTEVDQLSTTAAGPAVWRNTLRTNPYYDWTYQSYRGTGESKKVRRPGNLPPTCPRPRTPVGWQCDEFPNASMQKGGTTGRYSVDPISGRMPSLQMMPGATENSREGNKLKNDLYSRCGPGGGYMEQGDDFLVVPLIASGAIPGAALPATTAFCRIR
jgi:hypothetical protein